MREKDRVMYTKRVVKREREKYLDSVRLCFRSMPKITFFGRSQACSKTPLRNTMYWTLDAT